MHRLAMHNFHARQMSPVESKIRPAQNWQKSCVIKQHNEYNAAAERGLENDVVSFIIFYHGKRARASTFARVYTEG